MTIYRETGFEVKLQLRSPRLELAFRLSRQLFRGVTGAEPGKLTNRQSLGSLEATFSTATTNRIRLTQTAYASLKTAKDWDFGRFLQVMVIIECFQNTRSPTRSDMS